MPDRFVPSIPILAALGTRAGIREGAPTARAWRFLTVGVLAWAGGAGLWWVRGLGVDGQAPETGAEDLGYVAFAVLLLLALGDAARRLGAPVRVFLDGVLIVAALAVALWPSVLDDVLARYQAGNLAPALALVAADVLAAVILATALSPRLPPPARRILPCFAGAVALLTIADVLYVVDLGAYRGVSAADPLWTAAFVLLAVAALEASRRHGDREPDWSTRRDPLWSELAAYPIALAATGVVVWQAADDRAISSGQASVAAVGGVALLVRHLAGVVAHHRLRRRLEAEVDRRTAAADAAAEDYRLLFADVPVPAFVVDRDELLVVRANHMATATYGEVARRPFPELAAPVGRSAVAAAVRAGHLDGVVELRSAEGTVVEASTTSRPVVVDGRAALLVLANDRTLELQAGRRIEVLARTDDLTGLGNRLALQEVLAATTGHGVDGMVAVLLIDLDRFKSINDSLGHHTGDQVLRTVGDRIGTVPDVQAARLGGDEFVVVARVREPGDALALAHGVAERLLAPITTEHRALVVTASIGVVTADARAATPTDLLRDADLAMYRAKEHGRNRVEVFDKASRLPAIRRLRIEQSLRQGMGSSLSVWYQPVVALGTGRVVGVEALVRWTSAGVGDIPTGELVTVAEDVGLINEIDRTVLEIALRDVVALRAAGYDLELAANVSSRRFDEPGLAAEVVEALGRVGAAPSMLSLELTETAIASDLERVNAELVALRAAGVRIAIDDFGVGYASLSLLRRLPVDTVKLDRSFVADIAGERGAAFVGSMLDLAVALGLVVVAEGVEDAEDAVALAGSGCHLGQGFLWAPPMPLPALRRWLDARGSDAPARRDPAVAGYE